MSAVAPPDPAVPALAPGGSLALSFSDPAGEACGQVRVEHDPDGTTRALLAVFAGGQVLACDWIEGELDRLELHGDGAGNRTASFTGAETGDGAFSLRWEPAGEPLQLGDGAYDQLCRVTGELTVAGTPSSLEGLGLLSTGAPAHTAEADGLERDLSAWMDGGALVAVRAARAAGERDHDTERVLAALSDLDEGGGLVEEARVSTSYDADGRQRRVGLELWPHEDSDYPRRAAGEALYGATVTAASGRWDIAFLDWRMEGNHGLGPYSLLRR